MRSRPVTTDGAPLTERLIQRGLRVNILAGSLGMAWFAMAMGIPLTMLLEALGASGFQIGLIVTIQQVSMLAQIPASYVAETVPSRKMYWASLALVHRMVWFLPALLPILFVEQEHAVAWMILGVVLISSLFANSSAASWFSWMADLVPQKSSGHFWGMRQSVTMAAYLVAMAAVGWLLDAFPTPGEAGGSYVGFAIVFTIGALLGMADIIVHLRVPEPVPLRQDRSVRFGERVLRPFRNRDFCWLTVCMGVWTFSIGLVGSFTMVYLKRSFGANYTHISAVTIAASLGTIIAGIPLGYIIDRLGARAFGAILFVLAPAFGIFWFFVTPTTVIVDLPGLAAFQIPQPVAMIAVVNLAAGGCYSGLGLVHLNLAGILVPKEDRTLAMGLHWSMIGLLGAAGPIVGGYVMDTVIANPLQWELPLGGRGTYMQVLVIMHVAIAWFICMPMLLRIHRQEGDLSITTAVGRLRVGNPLRAISNVYSIYQVVSPGSSEKRADAARKLGDNRTALAVKDLIDKLDDSSADVREEAVLALGKIGSPEAVEALIAKLNEPDSDLAPQIARALRETKPAESVDSLVGKLDTPDRETVSETVRTLGAIGDPKAASSLLDLLRSTDDSKILSASGEALARLGQLTAIYEIIPHLKATHNAVVHRSLAVAVGDLLGQPGEFYLILNKELQMPGKEVARLMKAWRRHLKRHLPAEFAQETKVLTGLSRQLEADYEAEAIQDCADRLFSLGIGLAAIIHGVETGHDTKAMIEDLIWRDEHLAIGLWFLNVLRDQWEERDWGSRDRLDVLLGVYFISSMAKKIAERPDEPGSTESETNE